MISADKKSFAGKLNESRTKESIEQIKWKKLMASNWNSVGFVHTNNNRPIIKMCLSQQTFSFSLFVFVFSFYFPHF